MTDLGFIKLDRKIIKWQWYKDLNTKALFIHLLLTANWEDKGVEGVIVRRGQRLVSLPQLAEETGLTVKKIRTCIRKLEIGQSISHEVCTLHANNKTIYTICNYDVFQTLPASEGRQRAGKGQAKGQAKGRRTILNKNKKNIYKKDKNAHAREIPEKYSNCNKNAQSREIDDAGYMDWRTLEKILAEDEIGSEGTKDEVGSERTDNAV